MAGPVRADDFYAGRQITYIVGTSAGGGYDLYSRILAEYLPRHIPGNPTIVVQNMPNASGVGATNHMYNVAPKDGTYLAMCTAGIILTEALQPSQVRYDSTKLGWVGTVTTMTDILAVFKDTGVATIADAKKISVVLGANGKTSTLAMQPELVNALVGTKFKIISGYAGGNEVNLAMDRGEVMGRTNQWDSWNAQRPAWIADNKLSYLVQFGPKLPELGDVPGFHDLVADPKGLAVVDLLEVLQYVGRAVFTTPGVPEQRMAILRRAFDDTLADLAFRQRMTETKLDMSSRSGAETQAYIANVMASSRAAADDFNRLIDAN
jgi:tripartite-type tricarboxylate transporter receptor subunit TctC